MGTTFEITLYADSPAKAEQAFQAATNTLDDLNACMSDYVATSELSQLSATSGKRVSQKVSKPLWHVLRSAQTLSKLTNGAFDVTVGPLTHLWRQTRRHGKLPSNGKLSETLARTGYQHLLFDTDTRSIELSAAHMRLDLGGIAKGYAVDRALQSISDSGVTKALVNGGGDLRGMGRPWQVSLKDLTSNDDHMLTLNEWSVATSGDLHKSFIIDGREFSHLIDPRTGLGLEYRRSVTVLAPDCMTADALASALSVLSTDVAMRLLSQHYPKCSAKIITRKADHHLEETVIGNFTKHLSAPR